MENDNQHQNKELNDMLEDNQYPEKHIYPRISPLLAALIGLIGVFVLYQFGGTILLLSVLGMDYTRDVNALRLITIAGQILFILLPALILTKFVYEDVGTAIRFKFPAWKEIIILSLGLIILNISLQSYLYVQNYLVTKLAAIVPFVEQAKNILDQFDKKIEESYTKLLFSQTWWESLLVVIAVALTPAVCEETFFRGYIQRTFEMKFRPFKSAFVTALFFGLYHFHPYQIIPLVALGLYFGFAAYKTNSIFVPVTLHFLNNFIAVLMFFFIGKDNLSSSESLSVSDFQLSLFLFITLSILFILLIVVFIRNYYRHSK